MEAFSLLKFWRNSGADSCSDHILTGNNSVDVRNRAPEAEDNTDGDDDSFFELELSAPNCSHKEEKKGETYGNQAENVTSKAKVFPIDSNSKPQSPISLLKSAPKFRIFLLGFNKKSSKSEKTQVIEDLASTPKVEEVPAVSSLFSRDNSLRSKLQRERPFDDSSKPKLSKDVPKYLKLIKPLYIRASKRFTDKIISSDQLLCSEKPLSSPATAPPCSPRKLKEEKRRNRTAGLKVVSKHLGKSRLASNSSIVMISSPANRRDDSLLLQNDGIQSAILYCKRSYSTSAKDCSSLLQSTSEPYHGKGMNPKSNLGEEQHMRCSSI